MEFHVILFLYSICSRPFLNIFFLMTETVNIFLQKSFDFKESVYNT